MSAIRSIAAAVLVAVTALHAAPAIAGTPAAPITLSDAQLSAIKDAVAGKLKNPEAARFSRIKAVGSGKITYVCGLLNAKNSYGGYTGRKPFATLLVDGKMGAFLEMAADGVTPEAKIIGLCKSSGIDLTAD